MARFGSCCRGHHPRDAALPRWGSNPSDQRLRWQSLGTSPGFSRDALQGWYEGNSFFNIIVMFIVLEWFGIQWGVDGCAGFGHASVFDYTDDTPGLVFFSSWRYGEVSQLRSWDFGRKLGQRMWSHQWNLRQGRPNFHTSLPYVRLKRCQNVGFPHCQFAEATDFNPQGFAIGDSWRFRWSQLLGRGDAGAPKHPKQLAGLVYWP